MPTIFIIICITFIIVFSFLKLSLVVVTVEQESMSPVLRAGDRVLAVRFWPPRWLRKGNIVLIRTPNPQTGSKPIGEKPFIKRVVGLPNDIVIIHSAVSKQIEQMQQFASPKLETRRTWHIPPGYFFVQGDNPNSLDSRQWGPINLNSLLAIVIMRLPNSNTDPQ